MYWYEWKLQTDVGQSMPPRGVTGGWLAGRDPLPFGKWGFQLSLFLSRLCRVYVSHNQSQSHKKVSSELPQVVVKWCDIRCKDCVVKVSELYLEAHSSQLTVQRFVLVLSLVLWTSLKKAGLVEGDEHLQDTTQEVRGQAWEVQVLRPVRLWWYSGSFSAPNPALGRLSSGTWGVAGLSAW